MIMKRQNDLLTITISNSFISKLLYIIGFVFMCSSCLQMEPITKNEETAFRASEWIREYYKYYWDFPDSVEQLVEFGDGYVAYFWNDELSKKYSKLTWLWLYNNCKKNKQSYSLIKHGNYVVMINFKKHWYVGFELSICDDLNNSISSTYKDVVLNKERSIQYELLDIFRKDKKKFNESLFSQFKQMNNSKGGERILCKYDVQNNELSLMCQVINTDSFLAVKETIENFALEFVNNHPESYTLQFSIIIPIKENCVQL